METPRLDVLAIGTLARNRLWNETSRVREEFATTTLIRSGDATIVVDPGWPEEVMRSVLFYRSGLAPEDVTTVFLTHVDPAHARGANLFAEAGWLAWEEELTYAEAELSEGEAVAAVLRRLEAAPDSLAPGVDIFPSPGHTPGHTALLVNSPFDTTVVAGDAVLTRDHLEQGELGPELYDREKAEESFRELIEIADFLVPGHDNLAWLRTRIRPA